MPDTRTNRSAASPAVVLLSGGLDSATVMAVARERGHTVHCLSFGYGQRHGVEIHAARRVASGLGAASHIVFPVDLWLFGGSALTTDVGVPKGRSDEEMSLAIPVTYVPARNLIFLSIATAFAEVTGSSDIYLGVNAIDYSGYPDCRPEFIRSFQETARLATKVGVESASKGKGEVAIHAPLIDLPKHEIIRLGSRLGVDYSVTHSCYDPSPEGLACGECDSCRIRAAGFAKAGIPDPTRYGARVSR